MGSYSRVLVGTDGSETSFRAVDRAASIAREAGAKLLLVSAYRPMSQRERQEAADALGAEAYKVVGASPAESALSAAVERALKGGPVDVDTVAEEGDPVDVLIQVAESYRVDLIVVGNRGLNSLTGRLLGSVPSVVTHRSPVDVLIVHTTG